MQILNLILVITLAAILLLAAMLLYVIFLFKRSRQEERLLEKLVQKCNVELNRTIIKLESINNPKETEPTAAKAPVFKIPGVDSAQGLDLLGGDSDIYLSTLRTYAYNTPAVIDKLRNVTEETLPDYAINMHGLKGSSESIGAESIYRRAEKFENMAKSGNLSSILVQNAVFLEDAENLVKVIQDWLDEFDIKENKPRLHAPDRNILRDLRQSCEKYDVAGIDKAMYELERANYDTDASLVLWLRTKIDDSDFDVIAERLKDYEG